MSTIPNDTPDWFNGPQQVNGQPLVNVVNVAEPAGFIVYGPFNVAAWDGLVIVAKSSDRIVGNLNYYADQAMTILLGTLQFSSFANVPVYEWMPVLGPWVQPSIQYHFGAGTATGNFTMFPRQGAREWPGYVPTLGLNSGFNVNIAAGATFTQVSASTTSGPAHLAVVTEAASWDATVWEINPTGGIAVPIGTVWHRNGSIDTGTDMLLPSNPTQINVHNADGVAQNFSWGLYAGRAG